MNIFEKNLAYFQNPLTKMLDNELDFDFHIDSHQIETLDEFKEKLVKPYESGERIFYRGEKRNSITRPLLPALYRDKDFIVKKGRYFTLVDRNYLYGFFSENSAAFKVYEEVIAKVDKNSMYKFLAFSQHYVGISPFIDFTKSPFVAASFALKNRKEYKEDILIYTLEINDASDYTNSVATANRWLNDYGVLVFRENIITPEFESPLAEYNEYKKLYDKYKYRGFFEANTPKAKLIDIPTNDLMLFQQGVFLLLDDFNLVGKSYLTKKIRDDFSVKKWLISKDICADVLSYVMRETPYYAYNNLTDLSNLAKTIKKHSTF